MVENEINSIYLDALMRAEVKVKFSWMCDSRVDGCSGRNVAGFTRLLLLVGTEKSSVMAFLNDDKGNSRLVIGFQLDTSFANSR